ncbi:hypothetical protein ABW19_dt0205046 [Dactylella cylindrospora]|nr:hypothetical protein ABW19_dt0205046 [Dactylella cylindrospora]
MEDEEYYLQPGFDPNTLTMPVLRSILLKHGVDYPTSNVKKAKLVEIFETELTPQAEQILAKLGKVKASTRGIVNAEDYGTIGEPEITPTPRKRKTRRKTGSVATDDDGTTGDEEAVSVMRRSIRSTATPRKRTASPAKRGRKSSVQPRDVTDDEEPIVVETPKPARRGRKSLAAKTPEPQPPKEPSPEPPAVTDDEPAFSSYNPFQMGSSPRYQPSADKDRRRTMPNKDTPRKSESSRRKTEGVPSARKSPGLPDLASLVGSPTPTKMIPVSKFKALTPDPARLAQEELDYQQYEIERRAYGDDTDIKQEDDSALDLQPGEEFVPEEQLEVELEDENANAVNTLARRRNKSASGATSASILYALILIGLFGFSAWWRKEKIEVGYCGIGKPSIRNPEWPDWLNNLTPQCEPCPPHAICRENLGTECYTDYVIVPHPFSFWGIVPFAPTCQPDSEKIRRVSVVSDAVVKKLRDRSAAIECGSIKLIKDEEEGLAENDLKQALYAMKSPTLSDMQFNELWSNAIQELEKKDEVITSITSGGDRYFKSTNLSHVSLGCSIRKNAISLVFRWKWELLGLLVLAASGLKLQSSMQQRQIRSRQTQRLVGIALKRLAQQQRAHYNDKSVPYAYIPVNQLRDDILSREFNPQKRQELWDSVSKVVEMNSNVRTNNQEHMGDIMRVWTWIGSSALLDMDHGDEADSQQDEKELKRIMGDDNDRKELVRERTEMMPRILY